MSAGAWARDIARTYDALAENFESRPSTPENTLGAIANRAEAAKYHSIAARMDATGVSDRVAQQPAERCSMCRDGVSHSARCHHDEHEVCDRVAEGTAAPKSCACTCHSPADPVRCPKCGGPHPFHDPACVVHPDLIQDQSGTGAE